MLIDEFNQNVVDEVERLLGSKGLAASFFILVDGAFVPGFYREWANVISDAKVRVLFRDLPGANADVFDASPFLLHLQSLSPTVLELFKKCSGWPMLSLIESNESLDKLAERLASWCIIGSDGMRFNFRFADTRRLPAIIETLNATQLGSMFGSASGIRCVNRSGGWQFLDLPGQAHEIAARPQTLSSDQFARLVADAEVDIMVARLIGLGRLGNWKPSDQFSHVAKALRAAKMKDMSAEDTFAWCEASVNLELPSFRAAFEHLERWTEKQRGAV